LISQDHKTWELQNLYQDLVSRQNLNQQLFLQNLEAAPQLESLAAVDVKKLGSAVDVKNLGACNYVTKGAFYNVGGIVDGDQSNT